MRAGGMKTKIGSRGGMKSLGSLSGSVFGSDVPVLNIELTDVTKPPPIAKPMVVVGRAGWNPATMGVNALIAAAGLWAALKYKGPSQDIIRVAGAGVAAWRGFVALQLGGIIP
jgi:hypothetical protein